MGFIKHQDVLKIFTKTSIAVACSRWDEPLGRTSLEASSRGCATIISNKGGLPETVTHGIILKDLNVNSVYQAIKDLVENLTPILDKIDKQTNITLIDDHSSDQTWNILKQYEQKFDFIKINLQIIKY